jgi:cell division protein FtsQ
MPLEMPDPDGGDTVDMGSARFGGSRRDWPSGPWWRPMSTVGRVFLGLGILIVLSGLAVSAYFLRSFVERDGRFRIAGTDNIEATGLTEVSRAEMLPVFGEDVGRNIFFVPLAERRKELEQIPWVEKATVMRLLPDRIRVSVVERQPVAFLRHGQQIGLVDANGVLLTMPAAMMAQHHYSFPVVTGIDGGDPLSSRKARMAVYLRLLGELDGGGQHLSDQISEIDLTDPEDARVLMPEQGTDILAHFGEDHFLERYQRYKSYIGKLRQDYPTLAEVDLRYDQHMVLEMASGAAAQPAANAGDGEPAATDTKAATDQSKPTEAKPVKQAGGSKLPKAQPGTGAKAETRTPAAGIKAAKGKAAKAKAVKMRAARIKAAQDRQKKRAVARRAALNLGKQKLAAEAHPAAVAGQGQ